MAVTVQSSTTQDWASAASVTLTKPTGLAVGDLMIGCIAAEAQSLTTPSGWTAQENNDDYMAAAIFTKVADSSDVAASNFTFSLGATGYGAGALLRVDGQTSTPSFDSGSGGDTDATQTPNLSFTGFTPSYNNCLLVGILVAGECDPVNDAMITAYAINGTNPSWTEVHQDSAVTNNPTSGDGSVIGVAYATQATAAEITSFTVTLSGSYGTPADWATAIIAINPIVDATGTFTHLAVSPTFSSPTGGKAGVTTTIPHLNVSPTINSPTARSYNNGAKTNPSKSSTTWSNNSKS